MLIKLLVECGLPFIGHSEILRQPNNMNFMGVLDVISQFDQSLKTHIEKSGKTAKGIRLYHLSATP